MRKAYFNKETTKKGRSTSGHPTSTTTASNYGPVEYSFECSSFFRCLGTVIFGFKEGDGV
jgi:hypothetical protein